MGKLQGGTEPFLEFHPAIHPTGGFIHRMLAPRPGNQSDDGNCYGDTNAHLQIDRWNGGKLVDDERDEPDNGADEDTLPETPQGTFLATPAGNLGQRLLNDL